MLTPRGPNWGPSGTPAVALPPSIIASTVFLSASFLDLSSTYELYIVCMYCYGQCREALLQELDNDFLFDLVDVCDLCFKTLKGPPTTSTRLATLNSSITGFVTLDCSITAMRAAPFGLVC